MYPSYLESYESGNLSKAIIKALSLLESCSICPRKCKVNRLKDKKGFCKTGLKPKVCSFMPHYGEEPPISGKQGSGTIFFSHCNMACAYCQNYKFSQLGEGKEVIFEDLAHFMLQLQHSGCHNINLVTPTHVMPQILQSLSIAIPKGLNIPLVYNTGGYESAEMISLLKGIVDIYLPDMRYAEGDMAIRYSSAPNYPQFNQSALKEMYRQAKSAQFDKEGMIKKGVIIRHLVLPNDISGTDKIMEFIAHEISKDAHISLMSQYFPCYNAGQFKEISRRITPQEYKNAQASMENYGLHNGWTQESYGLKRLAGVNIKSNIG